MAENTFLSQVKKSILSLSKRDYIVESGENENSRYIRYSDGTQICYKNMTINEAFNNAWGSIFETKQIELGNFPVPFIDTNIMVTVTATNGYTAFFSGIGGVTTTSWGKTNLMRPVASQSPITVTLNLLAIGIWK